MTARPVGRPRRLSLLLVLPWLAWLCAAAAGSTGQAPETDDALRQLGERIYLEGIATSSQPVTARVEGDVDVAGAKVACVGCHRRSGLGSSEADTLIPPVTGAALFQPRQTYSPLQRTVIGAQTSPGKRPAYTPESLANALRHGVAPDGRRLDALMPRYALTERDVDALAAYLATLQTRPDPGVDDQAIHFATVVMPDAAPAQRQAMLDVLNAFFRDRVGQTRHETRRAEHAPWHREWSYQAYRRWEMHVWELTGNADAWPAQLAEHYRRQPVFAVLGGVGDSPWQPVHRFCEQQRLPCLFPSTDLPGIHEGDFYTLYFTQGLALEAQALAVHLAEAARQGGVPRLLQVYRDDPRGRQAAAAFRQALAQHRALPLEEHAIDPDAAPDAAAWRQLLNDSQASIVLYWLDARTLPSLAEAMKDVTARRKHYFSSTLLNGKPDAIPERLRTNARLLHPFALPDRWPQQLARTRVWLQARHIPMTEPRVMADTFFTATMVNGAIKQIRGNFSRDYFIERLEHMTENSLTPSVYPRLSLGPDQRFASKGCYLLTLGEPGTAGIADATWIVP